MPGLPADLLDAGEAMTVKVIGLGGEFPQPAWETGKLAAIDSRLSGKKRRQFRSMVEDTRYHSRRRGWTPWMQFEVMLDLIENGWTGPDVSAENAP